MNSIIAEAIVWFFAYKTLNDTGVPVCCPYPPVLIVATAVKLVAGMFIRVGTTLLCLGYGIVRPRLTWLEISVVLGLAGGYLFAVSSLEMSYIRTQLTGDVKPPAFSELLVVVMNVCFGGWIFASLSSTRKQLISFGQVKKDAWCRVCH